MRIAALLIASLLLASVSAATVNSAITAFTSRTSQSAFGVNWTVATADATACTTATGACCYNAGTLTNTVNLTTWIVTISGAATGASCVSSQLTVTLTGTSNASYLSGGTVAVMSNMTSAVSQAAQTLVYVDNSAATTQSYKLVLPQAVAAYSSASLNLASLPLSSSAGMIAASLISLLAFFL